MFGEMKENIKKNLNEVKEFVLVNWKKKEKNEKKVQKSVLYDKTAISRIIIMYTCGYGSLNERENHSVILL